MPASPVVDFPIPAMLSIMLAPLILPVVAIKILRPGRGCGEINININDIKVHTFVLFTNPPQGSNFCVSAATKEKDHSGSGTVTWIDW
jgi:hypothetical protein